MNRLRKRLLHAAHVKKPRASNLCLGERLEQRFLLSGGLFPAQQFQLPSRAIDSTVNAIAAADFNGDSRPDIVTSNADGYVNVLIANADATFQTALPLGDAASSVGVTVCDLDADLNQDIVFAIPSLNKVGVYPGHGDG